MYHSLSSLHCLVIVSDFYYEPDSFSYDVWWSLTHAWCQMAAFFNLCCGSKKHTSQQVHNRMNSSVYNILTDCAIIGKLRDKPLGGCLMPWPVLVYRPFCTMSTLVLVIMLSVSFLLTLMNIINFFNTVVFRICTSLYLDVFFFHFIKFWCLIYCTYWVVRRNALFSTNKQNITIVL